MSDHEAPAGRQMHPFTFLSPLRGFRRVGRSNQGLTPLATCFRPYGTNVVPQPAQFRHHNKFLLDELNPAAPGTKRSPTDPAGC